MYTIKRWLNFRDALTPILVYYTLIQLNGDSRRFHLKSNQSQHMLLYRQIWTYKASVMGNSALVTQLFPLKLDSNEMPKSSENTETTLGLH